MTAQQLQFPLFPEGATHISSHLAFQKKQGMITYFNYTMPVFTHAENEINTFRMITSQFYINGNATQAEICRAFGVTKISVKRAVKLYRERGPAGFYAPRNTRGAGVLTSELLQEIQQLLDSGSSVADIAKEKQLKPNTLAKAILAGRLHKPIKKKSHRGT
jgi:transposase-like protein